MADRRSTAVPDWLRDAVADSPWTDPATRAAIAETALLVGVLAVWEYAYAASALRLGGIGGVSTVFVGYALAFVVGAAALAADARRRGLPAPRPALAGLLGAGLFVAAYGRHLGPVPAARWDVAAVGALSVLGWWSWRDGRRRAFPLACAGVAALLVAFSPVHAQARVGAAGLASVGDLRSVRIVLSWAGPATLFGTEVPGVVFAFGFGSTWVDVPYALVGTVLFAAGRRGARTVGSEPDATGPGNSPTATGFSGSPPNR